MIDWARRRLADWLDRLARRIRPPRPSAPVIPLRLVDPPCPPRLHLVP